METQLSLIPASEHPTALESQWLNAISPADFINNNKNFDVLMMKYRCAIREIQTKLEVLDDEFSAVNKRNPISSIKSRVKVLPASMKSCADVICHLQRIVLSRIWTMSPESG